MQWFEVSTYTAPPEAPASINDDLDIQSSAAVVLRDVEKSQEHFAGYHGVLIACYSVHPLVTKLASSTHASGHGSLAPGTAAKPPLVIGIFEASILTAMSLLSTDLRGGSGNARWGIVTTGRFWEAHLERGVEAFLGVQGKTSKFAGVQSTGLDAGDFHTVDPGQVRDKLTEATRRLLGSGEVGCVVMGCAGMAGLEGIIRDAAVDMYGKERGRRVAIVDGVKAGIFQLELAVKSRRMFES